MSDDRWSTIHVAMQEVGPGPEQLTAATERLEEVAAMLATLDAVGGVETRDPSCIAEGPDFVAVERPELIAYTTPTQRAAVEAATRALLEQQGIVATITAADHEGDDWRDAWKRHYRSLVFGAAPGPSLLIRPSWIPRSADDPQLELVLDPGRAFGTGLHESTRLCLHALVELQEQHRQGWGMTSRASRPMAAADAQEQHRQGWGMTSRASRPMAAADAQEQFQPTRVLDLGCGSGILGLAAARIWPTIEALVFADHDGEAIETARENAERNLVTADYCELDLGHGTLPSSMAEATLILANIRPSVLIPGAAAIVAALAPGGYLVLSGILDEEGDEVLAAYSSLRPCRRPREADWCALILRKDVT